MTPIIDIQVELPAAIQSYLEQLAILHYGDIEELYDDMLKKFIKISPWNAWPPLTWKQPPTALEANTVLINPPISEDLYDHIVAVIDDINIINRHTVDYQPITKSVFVYTAIVWWTRFVYPLPGYPSNYN